MNQADLKNTIIVAWLDLDPDQLAADVPVVMIPRPRPQRGKDGGGAAIEDFPYVSWQAVGAYNERAYEAFAGYKGSHTTDLPGYAYAEDHPEHQPQRHHARVDALAFRGAWLSQQS